MTDQLLAAGEQLTGEVVGVVYTDPATAFGVVELVTDAGRGVRCVGPLAHLVEGMAVQLVGRWTDHPRHGETFESLYYEQVTPSTAAGLRELLAGTQFQAVSEHARERVITVFGSGAGRVIEHEPERLVAEAGLEPDDAIELQRAWAAGRALADLVRLVEPVGWPMSAVRAVHARFGADAVELARDDPYALLAAEQVGFAHADALARHLGVDPLDPRRLTAAARAAVADARRREGHQHLPREDAEAAAARLLGVDRLVAADAVDRGIAGGTLESERVAGVEVVAPPGVLATERRLAEDLARLLDADGSRLAAFAATLEPSDELTDGQRAAVRAAFTSPVSVLTGGPGTGKTRTVEEVVRACEAAGLAVALCAPTGRAAKRLEELVGRAATTVHRLLEARPTGDGGFAFGRGRDDQLPHDLVVVDEVSMCDTWLAARLVAAIDTGSHLLLVGDPDQLPSVGPGDVLADLLRSEVVPATRLTEIHRQAARSRIVTLARELLDGEVGTLRGADGDVFLAAEPQRERITDRVVQTVAERAPDYFDVPVDDIQVLAPMYRGPAGVDALNTALKERLNPASGRVAVAGFHVGDRVMQTRNDPELDVANGDVGKVVDLARRDGTLRVAFPRGEVTYARDDARHLTRAWAVTVHKAQGGEWPVVILVCDRSQARMLWRSLVYTAVTRARRALIVVGQPETLRGAARQQRERLRHTGLMARLVSPSGPRAG